MPPSARRMWSTIALGGMCLVLNGCGGGSGGKKPEPEDAGEPLVITDMLKAGQIDKAQQATLADLSSWGWSGNKIHSGYMALDSLGDAKTRETFFLYSPALNNDPKAPVLLWLQGGPGASSLFGMFTEIGPFGIKDGSVEKRAVNWNQNYHLLFLDNPVGTGFSFTDNEQGYVTTHEQAGKDLRNAVSQFFQLFPSLRSNDFYITGESYAGKWVPAAAYTIHTFNQKAEEQDKIPLKGISIGDGAMDPPAQMKGFGDLLFYTGMIDPNERERFQKYELDIQTNLKLGDNISAFYVFDEMLNCDFCKYGSYYANVTGMTTNYFNFALSPDATPLGGDFVDWLGKAGVRRQLHVGTRPYAPANATVESHLLNAWLQGVVPMFVPLLENYKVLVYSGQNDVILGPPLTEKFLVDLKWSKQADFNAATKMVWRRKEKGPGSQLPDVAGYVRQVGKFTYAAVRGAGHMVPGDQPERALDLLNHFIEDVPFTKQTATAETTASSVIV